MFFPLQSAEKMKMLKSRFGDINSRLRGLGKDYRRLHEDPLFNHETESAAIHRR